MIIIVDYKIGNVGSILNMLKKMRIRAAISSNLEEIREAEKLILPGVGAFDSGIRNLEEQGIIQVLEDKVIRQKTLVLGICLGMQLMTKSSEEGRLNGLGWIDAHTIRFKHEPSSRIKVPHMGWNSITLKKDSWIFDDILPDQRFYFVHSYHAICSDMSDVLATAHYGYQFVSAFQRDNIIGVQFHPEKSHKYGMQLLKNFAEY